MTAKEIVHTPKHRKSDLRCHAYNDIYNAKMLYMLDL